MTDDNNRFLPDAGESDSEYYARIDRTEDHPIVGPALRKMMLQKAYKFPPFSERAGAFGMSKDATLVDVFVMSLLASALGGNGDSRDIIIDRLDGRIIPAAPPEPKRRNNNTKNSLENISDEQLQKLMKDSDADADTDADTK